MAQRARALVVEDEAVVRLELLGHLKRLEVAAEGVARGRDAIEFAKRQALELVLMDIQLADDVDGVEAARAIRELQPTCQIIFVTAYRDPETVAGAKLSRPHAYLMKPFDQHTVMLTVELALERSRYERERRAREQAMLRNVALLDASYDGIVTLDSTHRITFFNRGAERIFGWTAQEAVGQELSFLIPEGLRDRHQQHVAAFRRGGVPSRPMSERGRLYSSRRDGRPLTLEITIAQTWVDEDACFIAVVRDVTQQVLLEDQVRRGHRMDAVGQLATGVVHDLNNLLTTVTCNALLLRMEHGDDDSIREIFDACQGGAQLTHKLLRVAAGSDRSEPAEDDAVDVGGVIDEMLPLLRRTMPRGVSLRGELNGRGIARGLSPVDLEQVLLNLVINARDAVGTNGQIMVRTFEQPSTSGTHIIIEVEDDGVGMDDEMKARALDPFFTTKGSAGNGVGLTTVYNTVRTAGGQLDIESAPDRGTTMRVTLHVADAGTVDAAHRTGVVEGSGAVWVVRSDRAPTGLDDALLESAGYQVTRFTNGAELLARLEDEAPDVLVTPPLVEGVHGAELAAAVRSRAPGAGIVFTSAAFELYAGIPLGPAPFSKLNRPYAASELTQAVARSLAEARGDAAT